MKTKGKKILVTGGAGFIGSHLCERLLNEGNNLICVDNFHTGSEFNIRHLMGKPNFEVVKHDILYPLDIEVDEIFNLACPASPVHYQFDPIQTTKTSVLGAINMLNLATKLGVPIFQASTSEVYGDPVMSPQPEAYWGNVNPVGIRSCYDEGKRCAESLFFDYQRQWNTKIRVARIFNTYGPRMGLNDGRVVPNFINQALKNEPITIYGHGTQSRSFCYVDDLVNGIIKFSQAPSKICGPINLGNPQEITIAYLAQKIMELTNSSSRISFLPLPSDDPTRRKPDINLAKINLDWMPNVGLEKGLYKTIDYFKHRLDSSSI
jgi:UDP-glucuronate decarboxylase